MTERKRSHDGTRETDEFIEDMPPTPGQQDRARNELARDIGTKAELDRATQQGRQGVTRVQKADKDVNGEEG